MYRKISHVGSVNEFREANFWLCSLTVLAQICSCANTSKVDQFVHAHDLAAFVRSRTYGQLQEFQNPEA